MKPAYPLLVFRTEAQISGDAKVPFTTELRPNPTLIDNNHFTFINTLVNYTCKTSQILTSTSQSLSNSEFLRPQPLPNRLFASFNFKKFH